MSNIFLLLYFKCWPTWQTGVCQNIFAIDMRLSILKLKNCAKFKFDIVDTRMKIIEFRRNDRNKLLCRYFRKLVEQIYR